MLLLVHRIRGSSPAERITAVSRSTVGGMSSRIAGSSAISARRIEDRPANLWLADGTTCRRTLAIERRRR